MLHHLQMLITSFLQALKSVLWVCMLMTVILYIFGVMATEYFGRIGGIHTSVENETYTPGNTLQWFGTVGKSMLSLLQIATMDSWSSQIARPIIMSQPWSAFFFIFFLGVVGIGFLNLLTAAFVDTLAQAN